MTSVTQDTGRAGSLDERIAASGALAPAEDRVARFIAEHREEVAFLSAAEVGEALGTSGATVVRTAQSLGYAGFPELKAELRQALRRPTPISRLGRSLDELGPDSDAVLEHVFASSAELIAEARRSVRSDAFRRAIDLLRRADRVVVIALGPSRGLGDYFAQSLRRFGHRTALVASRGIAMAEEILELGKGDVLIVVAHERVTSEVSVSLELARERGVPSVLVTDTLALALDGLYDVALTARRGGAETYPLSSITLVMLEAILVGLAARDRARTLSALDDLNAVRSRLASD